MTSQARRELFVYTSHVCGKVSEALENSLGKKLWHVSESDRYKLYRLWIWSQRYCVSLEFILTALVPYFNKGVEKRTGKKSKGLGVSISVLTGDVAEEILQEAIRKEYPEGDNLTLWREAERDRIASIVLPKPEFAVRIKNSLEYKTISQETKAYAASINKTIRTSGKLESKMKRIPWRGNPWR